VQVVPEDSRAGPGEPRGGQEAVRDGAAERPGRGALGVDVDPLVVSGGVGEQGDLLLRDGVPAAVAEMRADRLLQLRNAVEIPA
jgi:hypothetical protein